MGALETHRRLLCWRILRLLQVRTRSTTLRIVPAFIMAMSRVLFSFVRLFKFVSTRKTKRVLANSLILWEPLFQPLFERNSDIRGCARRE